MKAKMKSGKQISGRLAQTFVRIGLAKEVILTNEENEPLEKKEATKRKYVKKK
jgi:hypothetical protein